MLKQACFAPLVFALLLIATPGARADESHWNVGDYHVAIHKTETKGGSVATLTVSRAGKTIYRHRDEQIWLNPATFFIDVDPTAPDEEAQRPFKVGEDVLGLGAPSLAVEGFSGGAHCCFNVTVLILGPEFRALPTIDLRDAELSRFKKVPGRAALVLATSDETFAYWRAPFATSSAGSVILSSDAGAGRYRADADLMRAPLPPSDKLEEMRAKAHDAHRQAISEHSTDVPQELTQPILDLIYTGHLQDARGFLAGAWAGSAKSRDEYWRDLTACQLRRSPYWPTIASMNGLPPEKPAGNCPRP